MYLCVQRFKKSLRPTNLWVPADKEVEDTYDYDIQKLGCSFGPALACCENYHMDITKETMALNKV